MESKPLQFSAIAVAFTPTRGLMKMSPKYEILRFLKKNPHFFGFGVNSVKPPSSDERLELTRAKKPQDPQLVLSLLHDESKK